MLGYTGKSRELRRLLSTERIEQKTEYKAEHKNRQQVLVLYLASSALDSPVKGWSYYDGWSDDPVSIGHESEPPYRTGLEALRDGWRLIQASPLIDHGEGSEFRTGYLKYEFFFERWLAQPDNPIEIGARR